ncbi:MAG: YopX family protein [Bacteroides cellulosilyticus]|nr:YopX family protein [Bacteroides cellulosilyticus]
MTREIKFRGKRLDNGEWVCGDLIENQGRFFIYHASSEITLNDDESGKITITATEVDPATVGQYTGLKDKNGKEIYEGDILERYNEEGITMHINYFGSQFGCIQHWDGVDNEGSLYPLDNYLTEEWEVIGNIHDNPELLKGSNDD